MKISSRLSFTFSIIASIIFIGSGIIVFFFSAYFQEQDFQERLKGRVEITEKIFLEQENFTPKEFEKIKEQFLHTLPKETEEVTDISNNKTPVFKYKYPDEVKDKIIKNEVLDFSDSDIQGRSKVFHVKGQDYLIIVTAVDEVGIHYLSYLRIIIWVLFAVGIPLLFIGSFVISNQALMPLSKKIEQANTIGALNLHQRLEVYNANDEIGKLAIAFNKLLNRLEESFESQKSFIRNASHEIRNPLTAIMGEAEIAISKSRSTEEYIKSLTIVLNEAETLNSTVTNLLQLSKVTTEEGNVKHTKIDLVAFMDSLIQSYNFVNTDNNLINNSLKLEPLFISGNSNLLKTALLNLVDNACKFSSNQKVEVNLERKDKYIKLIVKDLGIGIAEKEIKKILTPFYRGKNALSIKGSGIGLSLSSKIIDLHHGSISIHSELNKGTIVTVSIPQKIA